MTMVPQEYKNFNENQQKLLVLLRSFDGDNAIRVNEQMVKDKQAISTGPHSQPEPKGDLYSSMESLNSITSSSSAAIERTQVVPKSASALIIVKEMIDRFEKAFVDKRDSLISVRVTHIKSPSEFYVQIDSQYVNTLFHQIENDLTNTYGRSLNMFDGDINMKTNEWCAFKCNGKWRRGRVLNRIEQLTDLAPEEPQYSVFDVDYGTEYDVKVSTMRRLNEELRFHGPLAALCRLYQIRPSGGDRWTSSAKDEFKDFTNEHKNKEVNWSMLVKGPVDGEPIAVILYSCERVVAGPFDKPKMVYTSANSHLVNKGLAIYERNSDINEVEAIDEELNDQSPRKRKTSMPFSIASDNDSVLSNLEQRFGAITPSNQKSNKAFQYLNERYPEAKKFFGIPTDLKIHPKEFSIAFRLFEDNNSQQPIDVINLQITRTLSEKGELPQFSGNYRKGEACTCYFDFDKTWNRAEIIGVSSDEDDTEFKVLVRFVDYDNYEKVLIEKLSSHIFGEEIPKLALSCQLINIRPNSEESRVEINNLIYRRVLDHKCRFYWEVSQQT